MDSSITFLIGLGFSLLLTPFAIKIAEVVRILDKADGIRKFQKTPTAALGGVAVLGALLAAGFHLAFLARNPKDLVLLGVIAGSIVTMSLLGSLDDRFRFRPRTKLIGQVLIVLPTVYAVGPIEAVLLFDQRITLGPLAYPLTILWFLAIVNAMNLIDGMDGLASTVGLVSAIGLAAIAGTQYQNTAFAASIALAGALCGFLPFNLPKARIYLGDCGSMSIGLILAVISVRLAADGRSLYTSPAILCLFLPLYDTTLAIVRRFLTGKSLGQGDSGHVHHRLQHRGYSVWQSLVILGTIHAFFVFLAFCSIVRHFEWIAWVSAALAVYWCARNKFLGHTEWKMLYLFVRKRFEPDFDAVKPQTIEETVPPLRLPSHTVATGSEPASPPSPRGCAPTPTDSDEVNLFPITDFIKPDAHGVKKTA